LTSSVWICPVLGEIHEKVVNAPHPGEVSIRSCFLAAIMKPKSRSFVPIFALAAWISPLAATPVITTATNTPATGTATTSTTDETIYNSFVSTTDLLHGIAGTGGTWNANGSSPAGLNDGNGAGDSNVSVPNGLTGAAWAANGTASFREFILGNGANGIGYDITEVQSIAAWQGASFQNQRYEILVSTVGSAAFNLVATVNFQPASGTSGAVQGGSTKVNVTDSNGVLASGVDAIRFNILDSSAATGGGTVFREIDVFGVPTSPTPPLVSSFSPADGDSDVPVNGNLVVTFDEKVVLGTGNITIKDLDTSALTVITLPDPQVSVSGAVVTIDPIANLAPGTNHAVQIGDTAIDDLAGTGFAGITDDSTWNFATGPVDTANPAVASFSPAADTIAVPQSANLVVTFNENVVLASGSITLKNLSDSTQTVIMLPDARVSVSGTVLTINPSTDLAPGANYALQIDASAIDDTGGNSYAGIADDTTWNFAAADETFSATQFVYSANVSAADLLHGLAPVTTGWNMTNNASPLELTDGIHGGAFQGTPGDAVQGAWTTVGATATYNLGTGPGGAGYNITSVQSIADWTNVGFGNQAWTIEVKPVGGSYGTLATVNYQPLGSGGGCTKVTLTHPSGVLATGIEFIRITANSVNTGVNAGAFVWRELDVFGVPSNDETPPAIISFSPADGITGALPSGNLVATFSENIVLGSGDITIKDLDTPAETVITLPDARVSVSGKVLTINPASDLAAGRHHAVRIGATVIDDVAGNSFAGIDNDTSWDFTTGFPDLAAPAIVTLSPADNTSNVTLAGNLVATFNEAVTLGTGSITIKNLDSASQTVITLPDARVSVSGSVLTINPSTDFAITTHYAVRISSGSVTDLSGNPFGGIDDDTTWNFVTASAPLRIMCMGDSITTGYTDNPSWANHPFKFGYRGPLYTRLSNAGYNFLFVGGSAEPWNNAYGDPSYGGTYTPALDLRTLGQDGHRGYGGKAANYLNSNILNWLASDDPDIILLKIGTNSQDQSGLNTLVTTITTTKPDAHLIIAQIMPKYTYQSGIVTYNSYIRDTLVPGFQAQGKKVTLVDQYAPFLTDPAVLTSIDQSLFSNGINHPDNDGYDKMAQVWFEGIEALGIGPDSFDTWISNPAFGIDPAKRGLDDDPDNDGIDNGVENYFGTDPGESTPGVVAGPKNGNSFTFTHPVGDTPADDLEAGYRWSKNLSTFTRDAVAFEGTTVTFTPGTPSGGFVTVTATVTGTPLEKLFVDVEVTRN
jgi:hypothetical protein